MKTRLLRKINLLDSYFWIILIIIFFSSVGLSIIIPLFPIYVENLGFSGLQMSFLFSLFYVGRVTGGLIAGSFYNNIGPKKLAIVLLIFLSLAMIGYAITENLYSMYIFRFIQGLCNMGLIVFARTAINQLVTKENRGLANGFLGSADNAGMILGPVIGGILSTAFSIKTPFYFVGILMLLSILPTLILKINGVSDKRKLVRKSKLYIDKRVIILSTVHFLEMSSLAIFISYFSIYAINALDWGTWQVSVSFAIIGIAGVISAPLLGILSDLMRDRIILIIIGLVLIIAQILSFLLFSEIIIIFIGIFLGGLGGAAYFGSFFAHIGDITTPEERSLFTGKVLSFSDIGSITSPIIAGVLIDFYNLKIAFYYSILLLVLAIIILFAIRHINLLQVHKH